MSHHFFLSYSRADSSPLLKRFFDDLSDTIRIELSLPHTQAVGFYEETRYRSASEWSDGAKQALQDSGMMVCLLSPAYFHCKRAGKEWQIFEDRWRRTFERGEAQGPLPEDLAHVILPVTWSPWHGPIPRVVKELLAYPDHIHQRQALMTIFKSSGMTHGEYAGFVRVLANQIIEMTSAASNLLPLDSLLPMSEVHSAFGLWDRTASSLDKGEDQSARYESPCGHAEFVKGAVSKERMVTNSETDGTSAAAPQKQSKPAPRERRTYYLSFAISQKRQVLDLIDDACLLTPYHVKTYDDIEKALNDSNSNPRLVPDLFVIDLDNATSDLQRIQTFTKEWGLPSTILGVSVNFGLYTLSDLCGATAILPSLFSGELKKLIKRCAKIGRDRRVYMEKGGQDQSRTNRPVFLSYSHKDRKLATFLSSNLGARTIETWTMDETLKPSDNWFAEIRDGLGKAQIFIALITKNYLRSETCEYELTNFYDRVLATQAHKQRPLLMPVLYNSPDMGSNKRIDPIAKAYNQVNMSEDNFLDGFKSLMKCIQDVLRNDNDDDDRETK